MKDYYKLLGIDRNSSLNQIKNAFRLKAKKFHPDSSLSLNTEDKFKEVSEAYKVLGNENSRRQYDREMAENNRIYFEPDYDLFSDKGFGQENIYSSYSYEDDLFEDVIFDTFYDRNNDYEEYDLNIELTPEEAFIGGSFPIIIPVQEKCPECSNSTLNDIFFCPVCYGTGIIESEREFSLQIPPNVRNGKTERIHVKDKNFSGFYLNIKIKINSYY